MIKPDTLWAFMKTTESDLLVGRICRSLGGQVVTPPLSDTETAILKLITQADEWHTEAVEKDLARRRARYAARKDAGGAASPQISTEKTEKTEKAEKAESPQPPPIHPSVHPSVQVLEKRKSKEKKPGENIPPTVEEVAAYCKDRGNGIDPEAFVAFYTSKGWKVGDNPMKNWHGAVVTWEKRRTGEGSRSTAKHPEGWRKPEKGQRDGLEGV